MCAKCVPGAQSHKSAQTPSKTGLTVSLQVGAVNWTLNPGSLQKQ